ncbi:hemolysin III family protein [Roseibacterium sp. SDUM158017]|uniref:PAQR family membrane homeostasis protein TrhA n=1 Tax=Roseicyclus salinarum TaxID=3036773 RepID=UPI0024156403|nr:hemolysin III family protein [Roseibacterium sp. SDUM158017]MDG4649062.1 hemolysin III family protein [Roseibacterium sp. SDUM158017]
MSHVSGYHPYSRAEYLSDAAIHLLGIAFALIAGPILVALAAIRIGDATTITAVAIYAATLLAMLTCSALYNMIRVPHWSDRLRRLDQSAIYLKIAGTYTPFVVLFPGSPGFLAAIWGVALAGASIIVFSARRRTVIALALYLGLGWAGVVWGQPLISGLSPAGMVLLTTGGLLYTGGVAFLLWHRLPFHNTIWHVFVLAATCVCYAAIVVELLAAIPPAMLP